MNFLAHLLLADRSPEAMVGSIMPDLVRPCTPAAVAHLPEACRRAIDQHRRIDAFTDTHPITARSRVLFHGSPVGRYAGILVDVLYDHVLARDWERHAPMTLPAFRDLAYRSLAARADLMPPAMRAAVGDMMEQDWLTAYASLEGIGWVLQRLGRRLSQRFARPVRLEPDRHVLQAHLPALTIDFEAFFPQLAAMAAEWPSPAWSGDAGVEQ